MPLFTYILSFKSKAHVAQGSHSNFTGFASTWASLPKDVCPWLNESNRKELAQKAYRGSFVEVPGVKHTWSKVIEIGGEDLTVVAVQTQR